MGSDVSPLGKYQNIGAFVAALSAVFAAIAAHLVQIDDGFLDNLAILGFGVLIGQRGASNEAQMIAAQKVNGQQARIEALHKRLDDLGAPAADSRPPTPGAA